MEFVQRSQNNSKKQEVSDMFTGLQVAEAFGLGWGVLGVSMIKKKKILLQWWNIS